MKKSLLVLGMAVAAFASCTNEELVEVAENRAIGFNTFVNNGVRAVTEIPAGTLAATDFYVFGHFGAQTGTYDGTVHQNELASTNYYWTASKYYKFGAYANGAKGQLTSTTNVEFDAATGTMKFHQYTPNDANDLIAAVSNEVQCAADPTTQQAVDLQFKHMLSQVKFTFTTTDPESYTIKISNLTVNAIQTNAEGTYNGTDVTWTQGAAADYLFSDIADVAITGSKAACDSKLVIPQTVTNLKVTFTAQITGSGINQTKQFTVPLTLPSQETAWKPGYRYNYTAEINGENIAGLKPITFKATVEDWVDAQNVPSLNPNSPVA